MGGRGRSPRLHDCTVKQLRRAPTNIDATVEEPFSLFRRAARNAEIYRGINIRRSTTQLFYRAVVQSRRPSPPRIDPPSFPPETLETGSSARRGGKRPCEMGGRRPCIGAVGRRWFDSLLPAMPVWRGRAFGAGFMSVGCGTSPCSLASSHPATPPALLRKADPQATQCGRTAGYVLAFFVIDDMLPL